VLIAAFRDVAVPMPDIHQVFYVLWIFQSFFESSLQRRVRVVEAAFEAVDFEFAVNIVKPNDMTDSNRVFPLHLNLKRDVYNAKSALLKC
jgi:hypothetical protein